jgi:FtsP/CotA-like multicopper oxidase with cupredoxin domain
MTITRRALLGTGITAGAVAAARRAQAQAHDHQHHANPHPPAPQPSTMMAAPPVASTPTIAIPRPPAGERYTPVIVPNGHTLPFDKRGGAKVFHLVAGPVKHEFAPGLTVEAWGYNGTTPGPLIEGVVGDRVRIYVTNKLPAPTTVHWHGMLLPNGMDGVGGLTQENIPPGKTFKYDFTLVKPGTFMYHPHFDEMTQIALGMVGMFVVHPNEPPKQRVRDFSLIAHEWKVPIGAARPDPLAMNDFNVLTFNSKSFPATAPLAVETGDLVRIRLGNLGPMDHHPIHIHGFSFSVVETDGGHVPPSARWPQTTVLVPVGSTRVIEFVADAPGDWAMHCHMTHHMMNQMGHDAPNLIGVDTDGVTARVGQLVPGYMTMGETGMGNMMKMKQPRNSISMLGGKGPFAHIDMGGMFTIVKVRKKLTAANAAGWYEHPAGTVASAASEADLAQDGIKVS